MLAITESIGSEIDSIGAELLQKGEYILSKIHDIPEMDAEFIYNCVVCSHALLTSSFYKTKFISLDKLLIQHTFFTRRVENKIANYVLMLDATHSADYDGQITNDINIYSITKIKVIRQNEKYMVIDGNARIRAYQLFFKRSPVIEVDVYKADS